MKLVHILSNLLIILVFLLHNYLYIVSLDTSTVLFLSDTKNPQARPRGHLFIKEPLFVPINRS